MRCIYIYFFRLQVLLLCFMLVSWVAYSSTWRRRRHGPSKHRLTFIELHCLISQTLQIILYGIRCFSLWEEEKGVWLFWVTVYILVKLLASAGNRVIMESLPQQYYRSNVFTMQAPASEGSWSFSPPYGKIWSGGMTNAVYTAVVTIQLRKILTHSLYWLMQTLLYVQITNYESLLIN